MAALASTIRAAAAPLDDAVLAAKVREYMDTAYPDLASLSAASKLTNRTLAEDVVYWETREAEARASLAAAEAALPEAISKARHALLDILERAKQLTLERYELSDGIANLFAELDSSAPRPDEDAEADGARERVPTLLERVDVIHGNIARAEAALAWCSVLERLLKQRDQVLDPGNHKPSAIAALPKFRELAAAVSEMEQTLPAGMALLASLRAVRDDTWKKLKDVMGNALVAASEPLKWPLRVDYAAVPAEQRRTFERLYTEMLFLQAELVASLHADNRGDRLGLIPPTPADGTPPWAAGNGLYPLQALCKPISLRFKYHFLGTRSTNRVDKPEWAFANIQDAVYEHTAFISDYLQPLTARAGFSSVDVKTEFTMLLFPTLLRFLRTRIPHLLSLPALLAHTVYQTVLFDDTVRENGFDLARTSLYSEDVPWEGLAGVILREDNWFEQWLAGETRFAEDSLNDIISSPTAWDISDAPDEDDDGITDTLSTESARQVRSLIEQITDRYAPLPALEYQASFLRGVQLPLLAAYHQRVAGSLEAFETLSSAFVRAVPGALGQRQVDHRLSGSAGLERLIKAHLSADYILTALRTWSDDVLFAGMAAEMAALTPGVDPDSPPSVWDPTIERYNILRARAEDMIVRLITSEVEGDLKTHLQRRWDDGLDGTEVQVSDPSLVAGLTSYGSLLGVVGRDLPRASTARVYRRISLHLVNHIAQRAVFSGWSKFTAAGGRALASEVSDWRHAAATALPNVKTDGAWSRLADMAAVLSFPAESEKEGDGATFAQAMAAAWGSPAALDSVQARAGVSFDTEDMQALLRRRVECWR